MPPRTILQTGSTPLCDLFAYAHLAAPDDVRQRVAATTKDAVVFELWGNGTSAYRAALPAYGGTWRAYVAGLQAKLGTTFRRTCLTSWSAGSQFVKDALVAFAKDPAAGRPDAIVMLDGLYGAKPAGSKPGDGQVHVDAALSALADYAVDAARGEGPILVVFHSRIPTPYASSKECAEALQRMVETALGKDMAPDPTLTPADLDGHRFAEALSLGNFHLVEFPGTDAKEHMREAHLYDEVWRRWVPWVGEDQAPSTARSPVSTGRAPQGTLAELALRIALEEERAGVGEEPPGSNLVKAAYWAGCTRIDPKTGRETLLKMRRSPWCAVGFQWCSYEAARLLGYAEHEMAAWTVGPVPHGRRVSVAETQHDMTVRGLFRSAKDVRAGRYEPQPGDACFYDREGGGHITRFVRRLDAHTYEAVGANEAGDGSDRDDRGDRWRTSVRRFDDPRLRGFGAFPAAPARAPGAPEAAAAAAAAPAPPALDGNLLAALDRMYEEWRRGLPRLG
jgi:hypothetical protein